MFASCSADGRLESGIGITTSMSRRLGNAADLVRELLAHVEARLVHRRAVDHGIGPREIDVLEDARREHGVVGAQPRMELPGLVDEDGLARRDVAQHGKAQRLQRDRFARDQVLGAAHRLVDADDERTDAERIAERDEPAAGDQRDDGVRAAAAPVHAGHRREDGVGVELRVMRRALELEGQHVQQHLGIGIGVDVAEIELEELALQRLAVGEVAVVRERDAERRIDVERLRLELRGRAARGRIAAVADADRAQQVAHVARAEDVAHVAARLVHVKRRAVVGDDAGGVLAAMLQEQQPVVEHLVDRRVGDDAYDSAHVRCSPSPAETIPAFEKSSRSAQVRGR